MLIVPAINVLIGEKAILSLGLLSSVTYVSFIALISIYFYYYYHLCFSDSYTHIWVRHKYAPECSFEQFCNNFQDFQSNGGIRVFYLWLSVKNLTRVLKINLRVLSNIYIYIYEMIFMTQFLTLIHRHFSTAWHGKHGCVPLHLLCFVDEWLV